jgi:ferredoxin-NADP reductase
VLQTHDRDVVFVYTRTQDAAAAAQQAISDLLAERSIPAQVVVERWHPIAEQWELPEAPLPADDAAERTERTLLDAAETRESLAFGAAMYDVRVKLPSHREVVELTASLAAEGYSVVRRWRFLIVGANNADQAAEFEAAIRQQAPEGAELSVESHINPNPPRYDP